VALVFDKTFSAEVKSSSIVMYLSPIISVATQHIITNYAAALLSLRSSKNTFTSSIKIMNYAVDLLPTLADGLNLTFILLF
jgi:hypothetical protein